jgi:hypothetical protein
MNCWSYGGSLLLDQLQVVPPIRLRSRSVIWTIDPAPLQDVYRIVDRWGESWLSNVPVNGEIVDVPINCHIESILHLKKKMCALDAWGYSDSSVCDVGFVQQTTSPILDYPLRPFKGGLTVLHQVSLEAIVYLYCGVWVGLLSLYLLIKANDFLCR